MCKTFQNIYLNSFSPSFIPLFLSFLIEPAKATGSIISSLSVRFTPLLIFHCGLFIDIITQNLPFFFRSLRIAQAVNLRTTTFRFCSTKSPEILVAKKNNHMKDDVTSNQSPEIQVGEKTVEKKSESEIMSPSLLDNVTSSQPHNNIDISKSAVDGAIPLFPNPLNEGEGKVAEKTNHMTDDVTSNQSPEIEAETKEKPKRDVNLKVKIKGMTVHSTMKARQENVRSFLYSHGVQYTDTLYNPNDHNWTVFCTNENEMQKLISLNNTQVDGNKIKVWKPIPENKG